MITGAYDGLCRGARNPVAALLAEILAARRSRPAPGAAQRFHNLIVRRADQLLPATTAKIKMVGIMQIARRTVHKTNRPEIALS
jgi:hypothetical protein